VVDLTFQLADRDTRILLKTAVVMLRKTGI